jgi:hypothetical protein
MLREGLRRFPRRIAAGIVVLVALLLPVVATAGQE